MTDQEGGWIAHLKKGFTIPPSSYAIGKLGDRRVAFLAGKMIAAELSGIGINMNFAPVGDLYLNEKNIVIGPRSFGTSSETVMGMMSEFIKAHIQQDVLPVIKHYPGLGRVEKDPHTSLVVNNADYKTLLKTDLRPFTELLRTYENGVMIGNVIVPSIVKFMETVNKEDYKKFHRLPATISEIIVNKHLIQHQGYKGLIVSDEMNVSPIKKLGPMKEVVYLALRSGIDIVLINQKPDKIIKIMKYLRKQYESDSKFREQMEISLKKILNYKAYIFRKQNRDNYLSEKYFNIAKFKKDPDFLKKINNKSFKKLNKIISLSTVDIIKNENDILPLADKINIKSKRFIVISSKSILFRKCAEYIHGNRLKFIKINPYITEKLQGNDINDILDKIDNKSWIIFSVHSRIHAEIVKEIYKKNKNIIIINLLHPYNIKELLMIKTILATYSDNNTQVEAAVDFLFKGIKDNKEINKMYQVF